MTLRTYTTPGTYTFTVPTGCTSITVRAVPGGSGGSGGGGDNGDTGGGGFAGTSFTNTIAVTPGDVATIVVGTGGAGGIGKYAGSGSMAAQAFGVPGTDTTFTINGTTLTAAHNPQRVSDSGASCGAMRNATNSDYTTWYGVTTMGFKNCSGNGTAGNHGGGGGGGCSYKSGDCTGASGIYALIAYGNGGKGGDGYLEIKYTVVIPNPDIIIGGVIYAHHLNDLRTRISDEATRRAVTVTLPALVVVGNNIAGTGYTSYRNAIVALKPTMTSQPPTRTAGQAVTAADWQSLYTVLSTLENE